MCAWPSVALLVHRGAGSEDGHRGGRGLRVRRVAHAGLLRCATRCCPDHASQPLRTLPCSKTRHRSPQDCRAGLEGLSARSASSSRKARRLRHSSGREHRERFDQVNGVSRTTRRYRIARPTCGDEILIRLLRSPIGIRVAQMGFAESSVNRVAKAISWLRANYSQPMKVEELAELVHMSVSSFHEHFKSVTSMSPLHYQKVLRLQEARRLMLSTMMDAGTACQQVGYLSASQFSREYSRFFGSAPTKDIARLHQETRLWI